ncbi:MAG: Imidazole glycerol phosphate synthase subunit HisH 1 [Alphaproteobacteria bacterium MarineAlpha9_Bin2]|mgnify:FL=1|nr:MAG: Imidazole glycerol phosphate synthase subunit HisH 1 [Alphaproteobacteria bacterium MarineAlpha9_Bin1]PPR28812.1 MAG: Imidazole glycerol phosphate synthase subunit HisH 1 [Alphaproteobacteria bacterium MarineAlpha9_Bin2]
MNVGIIDYGSGNIRSVSKSFERAAFELESKVKINVIRSAQELKNMDRIVLPGVGAFADCIKGIKNINSLYKTLNDMVLGKSVPFLGICVGMQLLANYSNEHGRHNGFGWIEGEVVPIIRKDNDIKIPHMGWNSIEILKKHQIFENIKNGEDFYFVHSYNFNSKNKDYIYSETRYGGYITAVVIKNNIIGTQFHPEKSQIFGIQFIKNFLEWIP